MKIIKARKLRKIINLYAQDTSIEDKNTYGYTFFRGVYNARLFGLCIYRHKKLYDTLFNQIKNKKL